MTVDPELSHLGRELFGRRARLLVAAWVLGVDSGVFSQAQAVAGVQLPQSNVREELERLVRMGMVIDAPKTEGPGRRYYARVEHPAWRIVDAAISAAREMKAQAGDLPSGTTTSPTSYHP